MKQAQKNWTKAARDTWMSLQNFLKKWMEKGLHSQENALCPLVRKLPSLLWEPSQVMGKEMGLWKSQAPDGPPSLALPGLYLFLGGVVPSLLTEKGKRIPQCSVW